MSPRPFFRSLQILVWIVASLHFSCVKSSATATAAPLRSGTLHYQLSIKNPSRQYLQVQLDVPKGAARGRSTQLAIPAWAPGSYLIRDFGRHVYRVKAEDRSGSALEVERNSKQQWTVHNRGKAFRLRYEVFADELSVRTAFVNDSMALLNTSAVFMYLRQGKKLPATLKVDAPPSWKVYTSLSPTNGGYQSPNYDELVDAPIMMGAKAFEATFEVDQSKFHYVALAPGGTNADFERLAKDAQAVVKTFESIMGGIDFGEYTFLVLLDPLARGGLEHKYSTAMILRPFSFDDPEGYVYAQSLLAHEFFHAWNVKRIHDKKLGPFDYDKEVYTDLLWFHEGFTETIEAQSLRMANTYDAQGYLDIIAESWTKYLAHPGRNHSSIAELSRDAWIKFYRSAANLKNTSISYYGKGDLIGVCLDLTIRLAAAKQGRDASLASMFRRLWGQRNGHETVAIDKNDVIAAASKEAGQKLNAFFERYVYGTHELPLAALLSQAGIEIRADKPWLDHEGQPRADLAANRYFSGLSMKGPVVKSVAPDSPAAQAKIHAHDEIIAVGGKRWRKGFSLEEQLLGHALDAPVKIALFRRARLVEVELRPQESALRDWSFRPLPLAERSPLQQRVLKAWLGLSTDLK